MICTPDNLVAQSACLGAISQHDQGAIEINLLCQWANASKCTTPLSWSPPTALGDWTDKNGAHVGNLATFLATADFATVTSLVLDNNGLTNVVGLCNLPALQTLNVSQGGAHTFSNVLDLTGLHALTQVLASGAGITGIVGLSGLTNLTLADLQDNSITGTIDASGDTALTLLYVSLNSTTTSLNVTGCTTLQRIYAGGDSNLSSITGLSDTSGSLQRVFLDGIAITSLNLSGFSKLVELSAIGCPNLTSVNLTNCTSLFTVDVGASDLTGNSGLLVGGCTILSTLYCSNNSNLTALNLTNLSFLSDVNCASCALTALPLTGCSNLSSLSCYSNPLHSLDVSDCVALTYLDADTCNIGFSGPTNVVGLNNTSVQYLYLYNNPLIETIDFSAVTDFIDFACYGCGLTAGSLSMPPNASGATNGVGINADDNGSLTTVNLNSMVIYDMSFQNCGLTSATGGVYGSVFHSANFANNSLPTSPGVDELLSAFTGGVITASAGGIDFTGPGNGPPTGCGDAATLCGAGFSVSVNGPCSC